VKAAADQLLWLVKAEPAAGVSFPIEGSTENTHSAPGQAAASCDATPLNASELAAPPASAGKGDPDAAVGAPVDRATEKTAMPRGRICGLDPSLLTISSCP
jgi:hypothetical protein